MRPPGLAGARLPDPDAESLQEAGIAHFHAMLATRLQPSGE